ncbi:putative membrane proteinc/MT1776 [Jeotgalicoccus saudimassiliensis]|uniref:Putative membrane proteinc/MT1776 n=1 Tax=Jeotgalicoccus saudimassiliensis TaxID=1461582 RepID=A0A078M9G7_9STAP|nr:tellurite resistance/C4-dicarboxylate transporter family protein [Jeotgalicoccus saudimassiliensis]CEA02930.1 putative membrane proteinc/MT1776 [Jeotgalicoccus saudimassiliensis]
MIEFLQRQSRHLYPGYFAMVMATGALSLSLWYLDIPLAAEMLLYFNVFVYLLLLVLNGVRLMFNTRDFLQDLNDNGKGPGFFTLIAASGVLGSQFVIIKDMFTAGVIFWYAAFIVWIILMYTFFTLIIIKKSKPLADESVNGGWLLVVVSTQSLAVLGTLIAGSSFTEVMLFISLCLFLLGCALYLNIIAFIFYRLMFLKIEAMALTPPYWISMGALAITTLAGSVLILNSAGIVAELEIFIKGFTLFFWALGTWWIPLLIILGVWRHIVNHYPLSYTPDMWGMAFPVAMYTVGTVNLSMALELEFLMVIPKLTIFAAVIVWLLIMTGLVVHHGKRFKI